MIKVISWLIATVYAVMVLIAPVAAVVYVIGG